MRPAKPVLPDVLTEGLDIVFCGTAPSRISFARKAYYANPGNAFWPTLVKIGLLPGPFAPERFSELPLHGVGLTDLNKSEFGNDDELSPDRFDIAGLRRKLLRFRPAALAFTSKTAASLWFGRRDVALGQVPDEAVMTLPQGPMREIRFFVLSSPSGRARSWWNIEPWLAVAAFVAARRGANRV